MNKKVSILGCGWLGKSLAIELINNGFIVKGSTTSPEKIDALKSNGIESYIIDISSRENDLTYFLNTDVLIIPITSKSSSDFSYLITQIEKANIKKVIFISSTSVYENANEIVTEETPTKTTALSGIEELFRSNTSFKTTILRFGGLFGYNRNPGNFFKSSKTIDNPEGIINFIHQDDCIQIIKKIITTNNWGETFNACSDDHPKRRDFYKKVITKEGRPSPQFNEEATNNYKIVNSEKIKTQLDYTFKYANLMEY
jgi:nucleoside-diphosphate-sugar epimerase